MGTREERQGGSIQSGKKDVSVKSVLAKLLAIGGWWLGNINRGTVGHLIMEQQREDVNSKYNETKMNWFYFLLKCV